MSRPSDHALVDAFEAAGQHHDAWSFGKLMGEGLREPLAARVM